jgi:hypothetical protein
MLLNHNGLLGCECTKEHSSLAGGMSLVGRTCASHLNRKINTSITYQIGNIWCQLMLSFPDNIEGIEPPLSVQSNSLEGIVSTVVTIFAKYLWK